nr:ABC transporter substrate-binding protein [Kineococcus siccus]
MYPTDTDAALALELPLVAAPGARGTAAQPFARYQADQLAGVTRITGGFEPNWEEIAALAPDLVLDSVLSPEDRQAYDRLSELAPTLSYGTQDWRENLRTVAAAVGREDAAARAVAAVEARAADVRAQVGDRWRGRTAASVFVQPDGLVVADADAQVSRLLEQELGLTLHPLVVREGERTALSFEQVSLLDADVLLVPVYPSETSLDRDRGALDDLARQPLWATLPAVLAGQVHEFDGELVYASVGTVSALLERLREVLG